MDATTINTTIYSAVFTLKAILSKGLKDSVITGILLKDLWAIATCPDQIKRYQTILEGIRLVVLVTIGFTIVQVERIRNWVDRVVEDSIESDQVESDQVEGDQVEDNQVEDNQVEDNQVEDNQVEDNQVEGSARAYELLSRPELLRLCWERGIKASKKDPTRRIIRRLDQWDRTRESFWK